MIKGGEKQLQEKDTIVKKKKVSFIKLYSLSKYLARFLWKNPSLQETHQTMSEIKSMGQIDEME